VDVETAQSRATAAHTEQIAAELEASARHRAAAVQDLPDAARREEQRQRRRRLWPWANAPARPAERDDTAAERDEMREATVDDQLPGYARRESATAAPAAG
jgi:hypothetical protein